jgi:hypothetical protein
MLGLCVNLLAFDLSDYLIDSDVSVTDKVNVIENNTITDLVTGNQKSVEEIRDAKINVKKTKKYYVIVGLSTTHLFEPNRNILNENNDLFGFGMEYGDMDLSFLHFNNSFYQPTNAIILRKSIDFKWNIKYNFGVSIINGYEKTCYLTSGELRYEFYNGFVLYENIGIMPTVGLSYDIEDVQLNADLFGNALITSIKYKF